MINIKEPIELLPPYYKDNDTYQDSNGKGILQRFLEIVGTYFQDTIKEDIDTLLDKVIDIDTMDPKLLNLIWEYMGSVPFAYGTIIENRLNTYGGNNIITREPAGKPRARYRDLLKYVISLYKLIGSLDFYPALLRLYNLDCIVRDPTGDYVNPQNQLASGMYTPQYDKNLIYDSTVNYDSSSIGQTCVNITLTVSITEDLKGDTGFTSRLYALLNKYRPIEIRPFGDSNVSLSVNGEIIQNGFPYIFPFQLK